MARAWINLELRRFLRCFQLVLHRLYLIQPNAAVLGAVKAEHWRLEFGCNFKARINGRTRDLT